jgi:hypothetical protein
MGRQAPDGLLCVHIDLLVTTLGGAMLPAESQQERAAADAIATFRTSGFGYFLEQATRPQTIGYALRAASAGPAPRSGPTRASTQETGRHRLVPARPRGQRHRIRDR